MLVSNNFQIFVQNYSISDPGYNFLLAICAKSVNPKRCIYRRNQSTLTAAGNPKITTHPSIVGRTGEEWEGILFH